VWRRTISAALANSGNHGITTPYTTEDSSGWPRRGSGEPLAAVNVVRRAGYGGVRHEVEGQRGDILRSDDAPDRERRAQLVAALVEVVAEEPGGQGGVDESGGDEVDPDRCEFEREVGDEHGQCCADGARKHRAEAGTRVGSAHEQQGSPRFDLPDRGSGDAQR